MNQELEQYLQFFIDHRQKDWPEWLALAEFAVNNKVHSAMKISLFMANYCYKTKVWTNFSRVRTDIDSSIIISLQQRKGT